MMSTTAAECTRLDTFGNKGVTTNCAEGVLDGFDLVPAAFADHTEGGIANNLVAQSASTRKDNTQEGINKRRNRSGYSLQASFRTGRGESQSLILLEEDLVLEVPGKQCSVSSKELLQVASAEFHFRRQRKSRTSRPQAVGLLRLLIEEYFAHYCFD